MRIVPARRFQGQFTLAGDKSVSHRLAILAALADGESRLEAFSTSADCAATLACLGELGVGVSRDQAGVRIRGHGFGGLHAPAAPLDARNSGSTLRMLAGVLAGRPFRSVLTGDGSLRRRPAERVAEPLRAMGAGVATTDGRPPLTIDGGPLRGVSWTLPVASAQVKTAVLLAGLQAKGRTSVTEPAPSRDHTERLLPAFGVPVERSDTTVSVDGGARLAPVAQEVPGDVSSAAFLVVPALLLADSSVRVEGVLLNPRRTAFLDVLAEMGGQLRYAVEREAPEPVGWIEAATSRLRGLEIAPERVPGLIDELPALAVAAAHAQGVFSVAGAAELRVKESDRIAALAEGLRALGARFEERPDGFVIEGGRPLHGARVRSHGDHRIAMALAVAALAAEGETELLGSECVAVSFPEFWALVARGVVG